MRQRAVRLPSAVALALLTLVALLNLSRPPGLSRRAAPLLEALVVGSTSRQAYLDVAELFIGRHLRTHVFTEANVARCVICPDRDAWRSPPYETFGQDLDVHIWADRPDGWWCAQARPSAALAAFLAQRRGEHALPQFLLVMDDDTWVHLGRLRALLDEVDAAHPRAEPLYLGFTGHQFRDGPDAPPFCYGGAGYVLNAAALAALRARAPGSRTTWLDACNAWKAGGKWCHYHSDWVVGQCLALAANASCAWRLARDQFVQAVGDQPGDAARCMAASVGCHGGLSVADMVTGYTNTSKL
jgi:hypothetical protein